MVTIALNEPRKVGDEIEWLGARCQIIRAMSRAEWWHGVQQRRAMDAALGIQKHAGFYDTGTKEFRPTRDEPPAEFKYCYEVIRL